MKNAVILGIGVLIGYYLLKPKAVVGSENVTKKGDKSKDMEGMQKLLEDVGDIKFSSYGQYDADTQAAVQALLKGTSGLTDSDSGAIKASFVHDLATIHQNSLKI